MSRKIWFPKPCPICGDLTRRNAKHCGHVCAKIAERRRFVARWKLGEAGLNRAPLSSHIRFHLIQEARGVCTKCGWGEINPATGKSPLTINHINGDPFDHRPSNLEVLCPNCHSLTPNYGALNKGFGRGSRKKTI